MKHSMQTYKPDGEKVEPLFPEDCTQIGEFQIELPPNTKEGEPVDVTMVITDNKNLSCSVECCRNTKEFKLNYRAMNKTQQELMKERESLN